MQALNAVVASAVRLTPDAADRPAPGRVLLVDDNPFHLTVLRTALERLGYEVACAGSAADALREAGRTAPDLVLSDVMMPDVDGFQLCRQLRAIPALAAVPVV